MWGHSTLRLQWANRSRSSADPYLNIINLILIMIRISFLITWFYIFHNFSASHGLHRFSRQRHPQSQENLNQRTQHHHRRKYRGLRSSRGIYSTQKKVFLNCWTFKHDLKCWRRNQKSQLSQIQHIFHKKVPDPSTPGCKEKWRKRETSWKNRKS